MSTTDNPPSRGIADTGGSIDRGNGVKLACSRVFLSAWAPKRAKMFASNVETLNNLHWGCVTR